MSFQGDAKAKLEEIIAPTFLGGDVLLAISCQRFTPGTADECLAKVAKLIDCVSDVWTRFDEAAEVHLGAVVVVLEGFEGSEIKADWEGVPSNGMTYPVTVLDDQLSAFFK